MAQMSTARMGVARLAAIGFVVTVSACASPVQPSSPVLSVDTQIQPAWTLLRSMPDAPWHGGSVAAWLDGLPLTELRVEDLGPGYGAVYRGNGVIVVNVDLLQDTTAAVAGYLAHEARHAEGIRHDCGATMDNRSTPWGAWRVHQAVLRWAGDHERAESLEALCFCD